MMQRLVDGLQKLLFQFLAGLMLLLVLNVLWQVASRYLLNAPSSFTEEIARFLLIWLGLFGAAYAFGNHSHLGLDLFTNHLQAPAARIVKMLSLALVALFAITVMMVGGSSLVLLILSLEQTSPALGMPMGYVYLALPLSGLIILLYSLNELLLAFRGH